MYNKNLPHRMSYSCGLKEVVRKSRHLFPAVKNQEVDSNTKKRRYQKFENTNQAVLKKVIHRLLDLLFFLGLFVRKKMKEDYDPRTQCKK